MRNVENQPTVIALDHGMDQSRDPRSSAPGALTVLKNCRIRSGRLQKRCGSSAISSSTVFGSSHRISDDASEPRPVEHPAFIARIENQRVAGTSAGDAFVRDDDATEWVYQGSFSAAAPVRKRFGLPPYDATHVPGPYVPACAVTSDGYVCTASGFGNQLRITIESPDGTLIFRSSPLQVGSGGIVVRVVAVGANFFVCYQGTASTTISARHLTVSAGTVGGTGTSTLATLYSAGSTWDASGYDGTNWFLAYQDAVDSVTVEKWSTTPAVVASVGFATTTGDSYVSLWADSTTARVWVGFIDDPTGTASAQFRVYTTALVSSLGPTTLASGGTYGAPLFGPLYTRSPAAGDAFYVFSSTSAAGPRAVMAGTVSGGTATTPVAAAWNFVPISKPDVQQRVWAMTHSTANFTIARVCLLRVEDAASLNSIGGPAPIVELASPEFLAPGSTYHPAAKPGLAFHAVAVASESAGASTFFALPIVLTGRTNASSATEPTARVDVYEYTRWNQEPHRQAAGFGRARIITGQPTELFGMPDTSLASTGAVEVGFAHGPTIYSAVATPAGGGLAAGTYVYQALQHWVDDEGNRHLSPVSDPVTVTTTVASSIALKITNCYVGQRLRATTTLAGASPETLLYRSLNGGTEQQLVPIATAEPGAAWAGYVDATDTVADSIIANNEFIYTGGGVLPNVLAPSCRYIAVTEERLWCGGLWDSNIIECSKVRVPGEPYNFTGDASHQVVIPGEVTGLAQQDGQIAVFCENAIYIVGGDGPNDQGAGGFAPPRALIRGVGCPREQSASILETEAGIIFRSAMNYYLIPRGFGTPVEIGTPVQDEDSLVLSASTSTTTEYRLAHFLVCAADETKSDTVLTLDLTNMQWVRDTYNVDGASITGQGFSEIGEWPDGLALFSYGLQRTDNLKVIWAHDEDLTGDEGAGGVSVATFVSMYVQTSWQYGSWGPTGWGRLESVVLMFEAAGACGLNLRVEAGDNGSDVAFAQDATQWTIAASSDDQYRYLTVKFPECSAYRVTLYDAATSGDSAGLRLIALGATAQSVGGMRPPINDTERQ